MASIKESQTGTAPVPRGTIPYFSTPAFALHSIPISYALSFPPHIYMFTKLMTASKFTASNLVPRPNLERFATTLPKPTLDLLWRARGCHLNALEGFPLFAAAMVSAFTGLIVFFLFPSSTSPRSSRLVETHLCHIACRDIHQSRHQRAQYLCRGISCRATLV